MIAGWQLNRKTLLSILSAVEIDVANARRIQDVRCLIASGDR